jgi:hypothetical protein
VDKKKLFNSAINVASTTKKTLKIKDMYTFKIFLPSKKEFRKFRKFLMLRRFHRRRGRNNFRRTKIG